MNLRQAQIGFVALALAGSTWVGAAEPPARGRGTTIIFSAPKADMVSSNLNELRTPATPFRKLEEGLKKPFDFFEPGTMGSDFRPAPRKFFPPATQNKKPLKELLNERAEEMFLSPELNGADPADNDLFQAGEESFDPYQRKPKTSLDRYYDRLDRNRAALTNRAASTDLFGEKKSPTDTDEFRRNPNSADGLTDNESKERNPSARALRNLSDRNPSLESLFPERPKTRSFDNGFEPKPAAPGISYREPKETRLDMFKRLLEGPGQPRPGSLPPSGTYATTPTRPTPYSSPTTAGTGYKPANPTATGNFNSFAKSAGLVGTPGTPQGLPDYTTSPTTGNLGSPTPLPKTLPPSSFNIPKRRF